MQGKNAKLNCQAIYFTGEGKKKLMGYFTKVNGKFAVVYKKEGEVISYKFITEFFEEFMKFKTKQVNEKNNSISR